MSEGRFRNACKVLRARLRLLEQKTAEEREKLALLRSLAAQGFNEIDQGNGLVIEGEKKLAAVIGRIGRRAAGATKRGADSR